MKTRLGLGLAASLAIATPAHASQPCGMSIFVDNESSGENLYGPQFGCRQDLINFFWNQYDFDKGNWDEGFGYEETPDARGEIIDLHRRDYIRRCLSLVQDRCWTEQRGARELAEATFWRWRDAPNDRSSTCQEIAAQQQGAACGMARRLLPSARRGREQLSSRSPGLSDRSPGR